MPDNNAIEFRRALEECRSDLKEAYWSSNTDQAKDRITACREFVSDLLRVMYISEFAGRTEEFEEMADRFTIGNQKLEKLKEDIDELIERFETASKVMKSIEKVLGYIPLIPL